MTPRWRHCWRTSTNHQPDAILDVMCWNPETVRERYGIATIPMGWSPRHASGAVAIAMKVIGRCIDTSRIASWVRRHDVVIVPGMGIFETTLPIKPWSFPYTMFVLCASGRLFRTKIALVSVGANVIRQRLTRWLFVSAARLAFYRSYRDALSRDAMRQQGVDTVRGSCLSRSCVRPFGATIRFWRGTGRRHRRDGFLRHQR